MLICTMHTKQKRSAVTRIPDEVRDISRMVCDIAGNRLLRLREKNQKAGNKNGKPLKINAFQLL